MSQEATGIAIILIVILSFGGAVYEALRSDTPAQGYHQDGPANGVFPFQ